MSTKKVPATRARTTKAEQRCAAALRRLLAASTKVAAEIDRLALVCDGVDELRAAIREAEDLGA